MSEICVGSRKAQHTLVIAAHFICIACLPNDISALESFISALEGVLAALDSSLLLWEILACVFTGMVVNRCCDRNPRCEYQELVAGVFGYL